MDDKLSLKGARSGHVNHLNFGGINHISGMVGARVIEFKPNTVLCSFHTIQPSSIMFCCESINLQYLKNSLTWFSLLISYEKLCY